ncbi:MAG: tRNA (adenosine(37)-N6)-threonylcarbamoyltransferase complex dimerization subunit type 1 TsaB [Planctomycetes bacterium]|nr:tRNA (adenosine(37)-N6)-threonylcarbamoyltransferase complex dimerization subunit type 1 TsaB [Planctomycetota bacterium]
MSAGPALALSGSNPTGDAPFSACLRIGDQLHAARSRVGERGDLARLAADLLATHGIAPAQLGELLVDLGPGSYTGLRVAVTFVRFLQHFGAVSVRACDTLALLATAAPTSDRRLRPLLDARRDLWHCGTLIERAGRLEHAEEPRALPLTTVLASAREGDTFVVAPGLADDVMARLAASAMVHVANGITAETLFSQRLSLAEHGPHELEPRYLMSSYAG